MLLRPTALSFLSQPARETGSMSFTVKVSHDDAAQVWFVHESNVPGLHAEASTLDALVAIIEDVAPDLIGGDLHADVAEADVPLCIQHMTLAKRSKAA